MAIQLSVGETSLVRIVQAIVELVTGRQNSVGDVTLTPSATTTVVTFPNCSKDCRVILFPQTANAAAALATTFIPKAAILQKQFTITHASNAQIDKTFSFLCIGG